jgi:hypothetical protein
VTTWAHVGHFVELAAAERVEQLNAMGAWGENILALGIEGIRQQQDMGARGWVVTGQRPATPVAG